MAGKYNYHRQHKEASDNMHKHKKDSLEHRAQHNTINQHNFKKNHTLSTIAQVKKLYKINAATKNMQNKQFCFTEMVHYFMKYKSRDCTFLGI